MCPAAAIVFTHTVFSRSHVVLAALNNTQLINDFKMTVMNAELSEYCLNVFSFTALPPIIQI